MLLPLFYRFLFTKIIKLKRRKITEINVEIQKCEKTVGIFPGKIFKFPGLQLVNLPLQTFYSNLLLNLLLSLQFDSSKSQ